jgi:hypothetical protein
VEPKKLSEDHLLDLIQLANVNYFVDNYDINSGMYMPFRMKDKAPVSVRETGGAMLSMLIGVEKGFVSKPLFLSRVKRIVDFLGKAQNNKGFYPAYFDGRKGLPIYLDDQPRYDIQATTSLMEALLIIRQYLTTDSEDENNLRANITKLWERLDWRGVTLPSDPLVLRSAIDMVDQYFTYDPLVGINGGMNAYMLAIASTKSSLAPEAFANAIQYKFERPKRRSTIRNMQVKAVDNIADSVQSMMNQEAQFSAISGKDSIYKVLATHDTLMYGIQLPFGNYTTSLLDMYRPFNTINPSISKVANYDLKDVLQRYTQVAKRRDNEIGVGTSNSDIWGFYQVRDSIGTYRINPAISVSSIFLDEVRGKRSLHALYSQFGEYLFTEYGFRAWLDIRTDDVSDEYIATNQASLAIQLENSRTGLIWKLYQAIPEIKSAEQRIFKK